MKRFLTVSILVFLAVFIGNAYAPDEQKFKVYVHVSADKEDKAEADIIESHLKRELRALGDVVIVDEEEDWQFRILVSAMNIKLDSIRKTRYISIATHVQIKVPDHLLLIGYRDLEPVLCLPFLGMAIQERNNLPSWCIQQASEFDKNYLKFVR